MRATTRTGEQKDGAGAAQVLAGRQQGAPGGRVLQADARRAHAQLAYQREGAPWTPWACCPWNPDQHVLWRLLCSAARWLRQSSAARLLTKRHSGPPYRFPAQTCHGQNQRHSCMQGPRDIYLGISGAILGTIPTAFLYFTTYEWCKQRLADRGHSQVGPYL